MENFDLLKVIFLNLLYQTGIEQFRIWGEMSLDLQLPVLMLLFLQWHVLCPRQLRPILTSCFDSGEAASAM